MISKCYILAKQTKRDLKKHRASFEFKWREIKVKEEIQKKQGQSTKPAQIFLICLIQVGNLRSGGNAQIQLQINCILRTGAAQGRISLCGEARGLRGEGRAWEKPLLVLQSGPRFGLLMEWQGVADSSGFVLFRRSRAKLLTPSDFVLHKVDTPQCQMCYITFLFNRILRLSKPCHVYVDSQAPIMQSFPILSRQQTSN